jgi:ABC-type lipoprotein release transport system permease subunit
MWIYIKLAWRNLFRNKRRSFIAGTAIGIGLASLIFVDALFIGMEDNMVESATSSLLGEGQVHREGFRQTMEVEKTIHRLDWLVSNLKQESIVKDFTLRVMSFGMITSPANVRSISLIGIDPSTEKNLSQIDDSIIQGAYFEGGNERDIVIGSKLAEILEVELADRLVVTVAQAETGDLSQELFRVSGIYHFHIQEMDRGMAFIRLDKAQQMLAIGNDVHEIAMKFTDPVFSRSENLSFWDKYSQFGNEAISWTEILPQMIAAFKLGQFMTYILGLILFGVVAFGIVNTLFMSLYERMFEFGVLRSVGTRPFGIAQLIVFEAGALAVLSIVLGIILGFILTFIISKTGIDYTGIEFAGVTFRRLLYPVLKVKQFIVYPIWVFVLTTLVGIYPAIYAARMSPARAMRRSL